MNGTVYTNTGALFLQIRHYSEGADTTFWTEIFREAEFKVSVKDETYTLRIENRYENDSKEDGGNRFLENSQNNFLDDEGEEDEAPKELPKS
jgi:hypothetical protein